jgi:amino acid efflux transporter
MSELHRVITIPHAIALYIGSLVGAGILLLPGLAAAVAGPASLLAWVLMSIFSFPMAYVFGRLSSLYPRAGGISTFVHEAFGRTWGGVAGLLFLFGLGAGVPVIGITAAEYLRYIFPMNQTEVFLAAYSFLLLSSFINALGVRASSTFQLVTAGILLLLLFSTFLISVPHVKTSNFQPFFPYGIAAVGSAMAIIFYSYIGWENVSFTAEEFKNPSRDFPISILLSVIIITLVYIGTSLAIVGVVPLHILSTTNIPFSLLMEAVTGYDGGVAVSVVALAILLTSLNAWVWGISRLAFSLAREGFLPGRLSIVDRKKGVPLYAILFMLSIWTLNVLLLALFNLDLEFLVLAAGANVMVSYVLTFSAGLKLLREIRFKVASVISLIFSVIFLPFFKYALIYSAIVLILSVAGIKKYDRRRL